MKRIIIIILIVIVVLFGAVLAIPVFFKQNILSTAKTTLNKKLNAEVEFADLKLSLFKNFPNVTIDLQDVMIKGKGEFAQDTLLNVPRIAATMNLSSLFSSDRSIEEILLEKPSLNLVVAESGNVNWDVAPASDSAKKENTSSSEKEEFQLALEKIEVNNARLIYNDKLAKMRADLEDINLVISGEMFGNTTQLNIGGVVRDLSYSMEGITYVSNTSLDLKTLLDVDFESMIFTIVESELMVNRLPLELSGDFSVPNDTTFLNLQLQTKASDFENFLALVPKDYEEYLKEITTTGSATISGGVSGYYIDEDYPKIDLQVKVDNGHFKYAEMPEEIKNISAEMLIGKPQGDLDLLKININKAHAEIRNNPVDLTLKISNPVSDPLFDGAFVGKINLDHLKDALPMDSVNMSGIIDANLFAKGRYSDVEAEAYDKIKSDGVVLLNNFVYDTPDLTQQIVIPSGQLDFSPQNINLGNFTLKVGESDFRLSGKVSNYLNYVMKDGVLKGNLQLNSNYVNLNQLLLLQVMEEEAAQSSETTAEEQELETLAFDVPENIDITFRSTINRAVFNRIPITAVKGEVRAVNKKLVLDGLDMNMLGGKMTLNGAYENTEQNQPLFDLGFDIAGFDIPTMYHTVAGFRKLIPGAGNSTGKLSTSLGMKGQLSPQMGLIAASTNGKGSFTTSNVEIKDSPLFNQLSGILKKEKLKNVTIGDFTANLTVEDGNLLLRPFTTKVIGQETTISGSLNAESLLDMRLDFNVQREMFGPDIQKILAVLPGNEKITMLPAGVVLKGPVGDAKVNLDLSATQKAVTDATKDDLKNSLNKLGEGLKKLFK
ncbi:AsmA family protein [Draconibacterium sp. IB214405]|uniref:AsmA family protein n=1 Tax=Draconibacterium sp. IB214405 TaxID=3097352 RepID=UPI002A0C363B|nr:AsmA family protein [Draconibacterium sp. IB214405]MDX8340348.1 AsmA family protein [Draconibacterium sp. IB214405]